LRTILICDFDDTIVNVDTGVLILDKFADGEWRYYEKLYEKGEISIEDAITLEYSMVKTTKKSMLEAVDGPAQFRPGLHRLLQAYFQGREPLVVASYGVDFCIDHVMAKVSKGCDIRVHAPKSKVTPSGTQFDFPKLHSKDSVNLKDDLVRSYKQRGYRVVYVGDGTSDFPAMLHADVKFAIKGSRLARLCRERGMSVLQISNFESVIPQVL